MSLSLYESNAEIKIRLYRAENSEPCEEVIKVVRDEYEAAEW